MKKMENLKTVDSKFENQTEVVDQNISKSGVVKDFLALIKIGIINSNIITAFTGMWLAIYYNNLEFFNYIDHVFLGLIGTFLVIAGSASLNNYIDRDIDLVMNRTRKRPTVTGRFSPTFALTIGLAFVTIGSLFLFATSITAGLIGVFGAFAYVVPYTIWTKRRYTINTVVGSFSGAVPPLIGWAVIDSNLHVTAWVLFLIMFLWQPPHFLALAMRKVEDYRKAGIPMLPVVYGNAITKRQTMIWIFCLLPLPFYMADLGLLFVALATGLNVGWLIVGAYYYRKNDDMKWATKMFIYSLNYLTILFVAMIIFTLI
jgi:heme o synthase